MIQRALPLLIAGLMHVQLAGAETVTFCFSGTVDGVNNAIFNGVAAIGDPFTVSFDVDTTVPDSTADPGVGRYSNAVSNLTFQVGSYSGSSGFPVTFLVTNDFGDGRDSVEVVVRDIIGPNLGDFVPDEFRLQLVDRTGTALPSDALPSEQLDPADFDDPLGFSFLSLVLENPAGTRAAVGADYDLDDSRPANDLLVHFGPAIGSYVYRNNSTWSFLASLDAEAFVFGDIDGNGIDDLIADYGSLGTYIRFNDFAWQRLTTLDPELVLTARLNRNDKDDLVLDFGPGIGVYEYLDNTGFTLITPQSPQVLAAGDLDCNSIDDLVFGFGAQDGVQVWLNNTGLVPLTSLVAEDLVIGDLGGSAADDIVFDFGSLGVYLYLDGSMFRVLTGLDPEQMNIGNLNGMGPDEIILFFGSSIGTYVYEDASAWSFLTGLDPVSSTLGDLDTSGQEDWIVDFGAAGVYVYFNRSTWTFLTGLAAQAWGTGDLDPAPTD